MRITLTSIFFLSLLCSCTIPTDVKLFNNSGESVIVNSGDDSTSVAPNETGKITAVFRRVFKIEIGEASYQYELEDWPGEYEFTTGWGPFTKRILMLQINSDGRIWVAAKGEELPLLESTPQPHGFPINPHGT